jgi:hypothetical protein
MTPSKPVDSIPGRPLSRLTEVPALRSPSASHRRVEDRCYSVARGQDHRPRECRSRHQGLFGGRGFSKSGQPARSGRRVPGRLHPLAPRSDDFVPLAGHQGQPPVQLPAFGPSSPGRRATGARRLWRAARWERPPVQLRVLGPCVPARTATGRRRLCRGAVHSGDPARWMACQTATAARLAASAPRAATSPTVVPCSRHLTAGDQSPHQMAASGMTLLYQALPGSGIPSRPGMSSSKWDDSRSTGTCGSCTSGPVGRTGPAVGESAPAERARTAGPGPVPPSRRSKSARPEPIRGSAS